MRIRTNGLLNLNDAGTPEAISIDFGSALDGRYLRIAFDDYSEGAPFPLGAQIVLNDGGLNPDSGGVYAYNTDASGATFVTNGGNSSNIIGPYVPNQLEFGLAMGGVRQAIEYNRAVNGSEGTFSFDLRVEMYDDGANAWVPVPDSTPVTIRGYDRYYGAALVSADLVTDGLVIAGAPPEPTGCFWTDLVNATEECGAPPIEGAVFWGQWSPNSEDYELGYGIWNGEEVIPAVPGVYTAPIVYRNLNTLPRAALAFANELTSAPASDVGMNGSNQFVSLSPIDKVAAYAAGRRAEFTGVDLSSFADDPYNVGPFPCFYLRLTADVAVTSPVSNIYCTPRYVLSGGEFWATFTTPGGDDTWRAGVSPLTKENVIGYTWPANPHSWQMRVRLSALNNTSGSGTNSMTFTETAEIGFSEPRKVHAVIRNIQRYSLSNPAYGDPNFDLPEVAGAPFANRIFFHDKPSNEAGTWVPKPMIVFENEDDSTMDGYLYVGDLYQVTPSGETLLGKAKIVRFMGA